MVLTHVQRAEKLFRLLPGETGDFLDFILYFCELFETTPSQITKKYFNAVTPESMATFIKPVATVINKSRSHLLQDPALCARELFGDYRHIFTRVCLARYMHVENISPELKAAVVILFGIESRDLTLNPGFKYVSNLALKKLICVLALHLAPGQNKWLKRLNSTQRSDFSFDYIHAGAEPTHIVLFQGKAHLLYVSGETSLKPIPCMKLRTLAHYKLLDFLFNYV